MRDKAIRLFQPSYCFSPLAIGRTISCAPRPSSRACCGGTARPRPRKRRSGVAWPRPRRRSDARSPMPRRRRYEVREIDNSNEHQVEIPIDWNKHSYSQYQTRQILTSCSMNRLQKTVFLYPDDPLPHFSYCIATHLTVQRENEERAAAAELEALLAAKREADEVKRRHAAELGVLKTRFQVRHRVLLTTLLFCTSEENRLTCESRLLAILFEYFFKACYSTSAVVSSSYIHLTIFIASNNGLNSDARTNEKHKTKNFSCF